ASTERTVPVRVSAAMPCTNSMRRAAPNMRSSQVEGRECRLQAGSMISASGRLVKHSANELDRMGSAFGCVQQCPLVAGNYPLVARQLPDVDAEFQAASGSRNLVEPPIRPEPSMRLTAAAAVALTIAVRPLAAQSAVDREAVRRAVLDYVEGFYE